MHILGSLHVDPAEVELSFIRSSGPGGQNVNKVATAVQLRFDLMGSPSLPQPVKDRAARLAGARLTQDGVIVLTASGARSQQQNREEAIQRLVGLLRQAAVPPKRRIATRPPAGSKVRRLEEKTRRGAVKRLRKQGPAEE